MHTFFGHFANCEPHVNLYNIPSFCNNVLAQSELLTSNASHRTEWWSQWISWVFHKLTVTTYQNYQAPSSSQHLVQVQISLFGCSAVHSRLWWIEYDSHFALVQNVWLDSLNNVVTTVTELYNIPQNIYNPWPHGHTLWTYGSYNQSYCCYFIITNERNDGKWVKNTIHVGG